MSRARRRALVAGLAAWAVAAAVASRPARTLPLFAREQQQACAACHVASARLTPAGIRYELEGEPASRTPVEGSGPRLGPVPLSVVARAASGASGPADLESRHDRARWSLDPRADRVAELHTLLRPTPTATVRLEVGLERRGGQVESDAAFVQVGPRGGERGLSVRAGLFDGELPSLSNRLRLTLRPSIAPLGGEARGVELIGRAGPWTTGVGRIASARSLLQRDDAGRLLGRPEDTEVWLVHQTATAALGARMLFDRQDSSLPTLSWMQHLQAEVGGSLAMGRLTLVPGYVFDRFDDRPAAGIHDRHQYYLLEATAPFDGRRLWQLTGRYELEYETRTALTPEEDHHVELASLARELAPGASVALEGALAGGRDQASVGSLEAFVRLSY